VDYDESTKKNWTVCEPLAESDKTFTQYSQRIPAWGLQITMNSVFGLLPQMLSELLLAFGEETALLSAKVKKPNF
jgi:hypothetical protein